MEIKTINYINNQFQTMSVKNIDLFVTATNTLIRQLINLSEVVVPESEYKGEIEDGLDFNQHQFVVMEEDFLANVDGNNLLKLKQLADVSMLSTGVNNYRLEKAYELSVSIIDRVEEMLDLYEPLTADESDELAQLIREALCLLVFPFVKSTGILTAVQDNIMYGQEYSVDVNLKDHLDMYGIDIPNYLTTMYSYISKYPMALPPSEILPDIWEDFIATISDEFVGYVLDLSEQVTVADIQKFNEGKLTIDDDYVNLLERRRIKQDLMIDNNEEDDD